MKKNTVFGFFSNRKAMQLVDRSCYSDNLLLLQNVQIVFVFKIYTRAAKGLSA